MFVIFGWGHTTTKGLGPVEELQCGNCHNTEFWNLQKTSEWFTLFFIPIFPYSTKYLKFCPICKAYVNITKEEFDAQAPKAALNLAVANGQLSREEYEQQMHNL